MDTGASSPVGEENDYKSKKRVCLEIAQISFPAIGI